MSALPERLAEAHQLPLPMATREQGPCREFSGKRNSPEVPELFEFDKATLTISRTIFRSTKGKHTRKAVVCAINPDELIPDVQAAAEQKELKTKRPRQGAYRNHIRVIDMFAGCGGMSLGIRQACENLGMGFTPVGVFEYDPQPLSVYGKNFGLKNLEPIDVASLLKPFDEKLSVQEKALKSSLGRVDFLVAGPPCQGHSNLNNSTRRDDPRNELYLSVARVAKIASPKWILIENVLTVTHDRRNVVGRTKALLRKLGYKVSDTIVDLWKIGVPQTRRRHVLFAFLPNPRQELVRLRSAKNIVRKYQTSPRTLRWAIGDLMDASLVDRVHQPSGMAEITKKRINYLFDKNRFDLPNDQRPDCHRDRDHTYNSVYGRMYWDRPAPTITGGFDTMGRGRFVHPEMRRTITPREAARIQCFPDAFDFDVPDLKRGALIHMIGNAVPPKLSYIFALECLR